jgi:hypothetical protein
MMSDGSPSTGAYASPSSARDGAGAPGVTIPLQPVRQIENEAAVGINVRLIAVAVLSHTRKGLCVEATDT